MKHKLVLFELSKLKEHEETDEKHVRELVEEISSKNAFTTAIVVDKDMKIILDGHHRFNAAKRLHLRTIPCLLVDYLNDKNVSVESRRQIRVSKNLVVQKVLEEKKYPKKTTRHLYQNKPIGEFTSSVFYSLEELK